MDKTIISALGYVYELGEKSSFNNLNKAINVDPKNDLNFFHRAQFSKKKKSMTA